MYTLINLLLLFTITTATLVLGVITNIIHTEWTNRNRKKLIKFLFLAFSICAVITALTFLQQTYTKAAEVSGEGESNERNETKVETQGQEELVMSKELNDLDSVSLELKYAFVEPKSYGVFEYDVDTSGSYLVNIANDSLLVWSIAKNKTELAYFDLKYLKTVFTANNKILAFAYNKKEKIYEFVVRGLLDFSITFRYSLGSGNVIINKIFQKGDSTIIIDDRRNIYVYAAEKNSIIFRSPLADTPAIKLNERNDDFDKELALVLRLPESAFEKTLSQYPNYPQFQNRFDKIFLKFQDNTGRQDYMYDLVTKEKTKLEVDSTFLYITNSGYSITFVPRSNLVLFYGSSGLAIDKIRQQLINKTSDWSFVKSAYLVSRPEMARNLVAYLYDLETGKKIYLMIEQGFVWPYISFGRNGDFLTVKGAFEFENKLFFYDLTKVFK